MSPKGMLYSNGGLCLVRPCSGRYKAVCLGGRTYCRALSTGQILRLFNTIPCKEHVTFLVIHKEIHLVACSALYARARTGDRRPDLIRNVPNTSETAL